MSTTKPGPTPHKYFWEAWSSHTVYVFAYRAEPVPNTGKFRRGRFYRKMRTTQERRMSVDPDHRAFTRSKRTMNVLQNAWDDVKIRGRMDKSWKSCTKRRHQWKPKKLANS